MMSISPFFRTLSLAYQAEIDDLAFDSEGTNVLHQRLSQRRKEMAFLLQMMALSPEMVAVVFHQAFEFKSPNAMDALIALDSKKLPRWSSLTGTVSLAPWARELVQLVLAQPQGEWFMSIAAVLEYMYNKVDASAAPEHGDDEATDEPETDEEKEARIREEAGADWMQAQGFDRKE